MARAFCPDPMFDHFAKDLLAEHLFLPRFFAPIVGDCVRHGRSWVAEVDGVARGFAGWLPPGTYPRGSRRDALVALGVARAAPRAKHIGEAGKLLLAMDEVHPHEPSWYLAVLGVDPELQRQGVGGRLIEPGLDAADDESLPCYLETQREENLAFYGRFGFEEIGRLEIGSAPPLWLLMRPAR